MYMTYKEHIVHGARRGTQASKAEKFLTGAQALASDSVVLLGSPFLLDDSQKSLGDRAPEKNNGLLLILDMEGARSAPAPPRPAETGLKTTTCIAT